MWTFSFCSNARSFDRPTVAKPDEKIKVPIFIRRKGADVFRPALAAGGSLMAYKCLSLCDFFIARGRLNIRFGHCISCLFDNSSVKLCKHDTPLLFAPSGANHEQGLGWDRVCVAQRSNESPSGAFKRQRGLRQQMEGLCPDKRYPNKITSEMQTHCRSEVRNGQEIFKN